MEYDDPDYDDEAWDESSDRCPDCGAYPEHHADYLRTPHEVLTDHRFVSVYLSAEVDAERDRLLAASDRMVIEARAAEKRAVERLQAARVDHMAVKEQLSAEVARLSRALTDWQDIATAPKDGTTVILWWQVERRDVVSYWACGRWVEYGDGSKGWSGDSFHCSEPGSWTRLIGERPTHWRPLPAAPERPA